MADLTLVDKLLALEAAISSAGIPHAFGGAIALAAYTEPRGTADLDLGVFLDSGATEHLLSVLRTLGMDTDVDVDLIKAGDWGRLYWGSTPIDFFFSYTPMHFEASERTRLLLVRGTEIPVLGPEDLIGLKAIFNRDKDWVDIDGVLQEQRDIDVDVVRRWLETIYADGGSGLSERIVRFNDLARLNGHTAITGISARWRWPWHRFAAPSVSQSPTGTEQRGPAPLAGSGKRRKPPGSAGGGQFALTHDPEDGEMHLAADGDDPEDR
ncbi:MAG: hypothetical protein M0Z42_11855 [Actinomycetota bacterium]|nr:hypothetical protein [Actinomycetota bacterium]